MKAYPINILYLIIGENLTSEKDGVAKKLISKVEALGSLCSSCFLINAVPNPGHSDIVVLARNAHLVSIEIGVKEANTGYLNKIKSNSLFYAKLASYIDDRKLMIDRIIFRYPLASKGLKQFCERFHKKIVFEHNTKEIEEQYLGMKKKQYATFGISPSQFFYWYQEKVYPIYAERFLFRRITNHAYAGSCVTGEIADYEKKRNPAYRTFVSSNFYDVSTVSLSPSNYTKSTMPTLGMIVTTTAAWYGLDRLLRSFSYVQDRYRLIIAGIEPENPSIQKLLAKNAVTKNINFLGKISKSELPDFYSSVHACFGSLGLYKIKLNYASTLKVKESVSFGVPVILGYGEEDFVSNPEFEPYYLQVANDSSTIQFEAITEFLERFYSDPQHKEQLRQLAFKYLDVNVKMNLLIQRIAPEAHVV